ncbi:MAG: tRNA (adenosine(37)-N6)-dimethylallyltransferase MiaA [Patescibacteria group bacterium]
METRPKLIAIVGPTASGKTSLALDVAERYSGEIVCADSRTIYTGMDIGTAKPTTEEQARVRHWGLDLVQPGQSFSAADYKAHATAAITDIQSRGKLALLVGGTGLYVDSVLYDYQFGPPPDAARRAELEALSLSELHEYCAKNNVLLPENNQNKRYVVRAIERASMSDISKSPLWSDAKIVGIATNMQTIRTRIISRSEHMFESDVAEEATMLGKKYGWNSEAMTGNIYPILHSHLEGRVTIDEAKDKIATADYQLAKRQMSWFRRNPDIMWASLTGASGYINSLLAAE